VVVAPQRRKAPKSPADIAHGGDDVIVGHVGDGRRSAAADADVQAREDQGANEPPTHAREGGQRRARQRVIEDPRRRLSSRLAAGQRTGRDAGEDPRGTGRVAVWTGTMGRLRRHRKIKAVDPYNPKRSNIDEDKCGPMRTLR